MVQFHPHALILLDENSDLLEKIKFSFLSGVVKPRLARLHLSRFFLLDLWIKFGKIMEMTLIIYLINRFFYRLSEFLRHWYFNSFKIYSHFIISLLEKFDRKLAFKVTVKHLFHPLYQDQTLIGYTLGFFFRTARLILGGIIYIIIIAVAIFIYLAWLAILPYIIYKILYD